MELVKYDEMCRAIGECHRMDEIAGIKSKAAQLEAYARVRDNPEAERQFAEVKLRACIRIGELSRELEKHPQSTGGRHDNGVVPTKTNQLTEAGIHPRTAERYEELTGGREQQAKHTATAAAETYFAKAKEDQQPPTIAGLRTAVRSALVETLGPPPPKRKAANPPELTEAEKASISWGGWIGRVDSGDLKPELAAEAEYEEFAQKEMARCERAVAIIRRYQKRLKELHQCLG